MRLIELVAIASLSVAPGAVPTKRHTFMDSISNSTIDEIINEISNGDITMLESLIDVAVDALAREASAVAQCMESNATSSPATPLATVGLAHSNTDNLSTGDPEGLGTVAPSSGLYPLANVSVSIPVPATLALTTAFMGPSPEAGGILLSLASAVSSFLGGDVVSSTPALVSVAPTNIVAPLSPFGVVVGGVSGVPAAEVSILSSLMGAIPLMIPSGGLTVGALAGLPASAHTGATPTGVVHIPAPALSSLLSSLAANPSATLPAESLSSILNSLASSSAAGSVDPALVSSLAAQPVASNQALISILSSLRADPSATIAPALSSVLHSLAADPAAAATQSAAVLSSILNSAGNETSATFDPTLTSLIGSLASAPVMSNAVLSSVLSSLSVHPSATIAPALSSVLSSLAADPSASLAPSALSSILSLVTANPAGPTHVFSSSVDLPTSTAADPVLFSQLSSLASGPTSSIIPALSSILSSIISNPTAYIAPEASSALRSLANNPTVSAAPILSSIIASAAMTPSVTSLDPSLSSILSSLAGSAPGTVAPALSSLLSSVADNPTATLPSDLSSVLSSLAGNPTVAAAPILSSILSSLVGMVPSITRVGLDPVLSVSLSTGLPELVASAAVPFGNEFSVPTSALGNQLSSLSNIIATATGIPAVELSSLASLLGSAQAINTGALGSLISELQTASVYPTTLVSALIAPVASDVSLLISASPAIPSDIGGGLSSLISQVATVSGLPVSLVSELSSLLPEVTIDPGAVLGSLASMLPSETAIPSGLLSSLVDPLAADISSLVGAALPIASGGGQAVPSLINEAASVTGLPGSLVSGLGSFLPSATGVPAEVLNPLPTILPAASDLLDGPPSSLISEVTDPALSILSSLVGAISAIPSTEIDPSLASSIISDITNLPAGLPAISALSSILDQITALSPSAIDPGVLSSLLNGAPDAATNLPITGLVSSIISEAIPTPALLTSVLSLVLDELPGVTAIPVSDLPVDDISPVISNLLPTPAGLAFGAAPAGPTSALSTSCSGLLCLDLNVGGDSTPTSTSNGLIDLGLGVEGDRLLSLSLAALGLDAGATATPVLSTAAVITSGDTFTTTCADVLCVQVDVGGGSNTLLIAEADIIPTAIAGIDLANIGASLGNVFGATTTTADVIGTSGQAVTATCTNLLCLNLGVAIGSLTLATLSLGAIPTSGSGPLVGASVALLEDGSPVTASAADTSTACIDLACVNLGLGVGPSTLLTATLGAIPLTGSGPLIGASLNVLGNGGTTTSAATIGSAISPSSTCTDLVCLNAGLGLGSLSLLTISVVAIPTRGSGPLANLGANLLGGNQII